MARTLGEKIRIAREAAGLTQAVLAQKAKISEGQLRKLETGRAKNPGIARLQRIARVVGVSLDDLASLRGTESSSAVSS